MNIVGNFLSQENRDFPLDCETLEYLQHNIAMAAVLGNVLGDKVILQGCELNGNNTRRTAGYVFLRSVDYPNGEVIYFAGGEVEGGMHINKTAIAVTAQQENFSEAYTERELQPGGGAENYSWDDFKKVLTPTELKQAIDSATALISATRTELEAELSAMSAVPVGTVLMWAGMADSVPDKYMLCDGRELDASEYTALAGILPADSNGRAGRRYYETDDATGNTPDAANQAVMIRLPDLRGRFIVGYYPDDSDYGAMGNTGGEKEHELSITEMPGHNHSVSVVDSLVREPHIGEGYTQQSCSRVNNYIEAGGSGWSNLVTSTEGGGVAHENRPPFFTLAYIMRVE